MSKDNRNLKEKLNYFTDRSNIEKRAKAKLLATSETDLQKALL